MRALDLCCGAGGMTAGMLAAGFDVQGVDVVQRPEYPAPLMVEDVRVLDPARLPSADWVHASPPCQRFSSARASRVTDPPTEDDLDILLACLRIKDALKPRFWSVENVRGAVPWFTKVMGAPTFANGPYVFWGEFPGFLLEKDRHRKGFGGIKWAKDKARDPWIRSLVPSSIAYPMADAIARACRPLAILEDA